MTRSEREIDRLLAATAAEYAAEEQAAAAEEAGEATTSSVFSVRLPAEVHAAVRAAAYRAHLTPSALIRRWVTEQVTQPAGSDLVAALRRDVDRVAALIDPPAPR